MTDESLSTTSTEVLIHECTTLAAQIASATCRFLVLVAELDRREAWAEWGCKSMAHLLSWRCSLATVTAREHVRIARALADLPVLTEAFERGELSYSKVRAIARVVTPESERELVDLARVATASQLEQIVRGTVVAMSDPAEAAELRSLHLSVDDRGMGTLRAQLPIDQHAIIEQAVHAALPEKSDSAESLSQRHADALVLICESYLARGAATREGARRNNAVIHVDVDPNGVVKAETDAGTPVHPQTARRLLCDASVQGMLGDLGLPIGVGRQTRTINRKMRRALKKRSGGACEWRGCTERHFVEAHHVWHWEHGGPTELWNLVNLCWKHHHDVHEGGFRLRHDGCGGVRCFRPDGTELVDPVPALAPRIEIDVENDSIVPRWAGERFDLSACVDAVLSVRTG